MPAAIEDRPGRVPSGAGDSRQSSSGQDRGAVPGRARLTGCGVCWLGRTTGCRRRRAGPVSGDRTGPAAAAAGWWSGKLGRSGAGPARGPAVTRWAARQQHLVGLSLSVLPRTPAAAAAPARPEPGPHTRLLAGPRVGGLPGGCGAPARPASGGPAPRLPGPVQPA